MKKVGLRFFTMLFLFGVVGESYSSYWSNWGQYQPNWPTIQRYFPWGLGGAGLGVGLGYGAGRYLGYDDPRLAALISGLAGALVLSGGYYRYFKPLSEGVQSQGLAQVEGGEAPLPSQQKKIHSIDYITDRINEYGIKSVLGAPRYRYFKYDIASEEIEEDVLLLLKGFLAEMTENKISPNEIKLLNMAIINTLYKDGKFVGSNKAKRHLLYNFFDAYGRSEKIAYDYQFIQINLPNPLFLDDKTPMTEEFIQKIVKYLRDYNKYKNPALFQLNE